MPPPRPGQALIDPPLSDWPGRIAASAATAPGWTFLVAGQPAATLRVEARRAVLDLAAGTNRDLGLPAPTGSPETIVMTGHQPEVVHVGVWFKSFVLQAYLAAHDAAGIDLVVDTDHLPGVQLRAPTGGPDPCVAIVPLAVLPPGLPAAAAALPSRAALEAWLEAGQRLADALPPPAAQAFARAAAGFRAALPTAASLPDLVVGARRRLEPGGGPVPGEVRLSDVIRTRPYLRYVADLLLRPAAFHAAYHAARDAVRRDQGLRDAAHPVPALAATEHGLELPFWCLDGGPRRRLAVAGTDPIVLRAEAQEVARIPGQPDAAVDALAALPFSLAPRAVTLTLFHRMFVADLFLHGTGGARYDAVTDRLAVELYGMPAPPFAVASASLALFAEDGDAVTERHRAASAALDALRRHPWPRLGDLPYADPAYRERALALAGQRAALLAAMPAPGPDRRAVGEAIRQVESDLAPLLGPALASAEAAVAAARREVEHVAVRTDRGYSHVFFPASAVQALVARGGPA
jgi:hypothetical protein